MHESESSPNPYRPLGRGMALVASLLMLGEFTEAEKQLRLALRSGKEPELIQARLADLEQLRALKALDRSAG